MLEKDKLKTVLSRIIEKNIRAEKEKDRLIHYGGRVFDEMEILSAVDAVLEMWLTHGRQTEAFEKEFSSYFRSPLCLSANSGSSANLIITSSLRSPNYSRRIPDNSIIATPGLTFPTTVSPLYYNGLVPLFIDVETDTLNLDIDSLHRMADKYSIKAVLVAHILGNTTDMDTLLEFCRQENIMLIEDSCEAMGTLCRGRYAGTLGLAGSFSMYASHHIAAGEGGMVLTEDEELFNIMVSVRDWGRIYPLDDMTRRIASQDIRYTYTEAGFNLKQNEIFSSIGRVQLKKLADFNKKRKENFNRLYGFFKNYDDLFILPRTYISTEPSWFGYPIIVKESSPFSINQIKEHLDKSGIETKSMLSGNITLQPAFRKRKYLKDKLKNTSYLMNNSMFIGVYPGIGDTDMDYILSELKKFLENI